MNKSTRNNLIFIAAVLAVALMLYLLFGCGDAGKTAVLQYGDPQQTMKIPLGTDKDYDIRSNGYTIHLQVRDGGIAFVNSPCPDHVCENFGVLKNSGDWAACMPALASVTVE